MRTTLRIGVLEDNKYILNNNIELLKTIPEAEIVISEMNSEAFFEKMKDKQPDALILDIELSRDNITGLDIAYKLKLPTLFVSGYNDRHLKAIEELEMELHCPVKHLTKPYKDEIFVKVAINFIRLVKEYKQSYIYLDFKDSKRNKIDINTIVYICSEKSQGAESNNKTIYFTNRAPELLIDFTLAKMEERGFSPKKFLTIMRGTVVNEGHIRKYHKIDHSIEVEVMNSKGKMEIRRLKASENFRM